MGIVSRVSVDPDGLHCTSSAKTKDSRIRLWTGTSLFWKRKKKQDEGVASKSATYDKSKKSQAQKSTSSASSDIPDNLVLLLEQRCLIPVLRPHATAAGLCLSLRYKEDEPSGWLSSFLLFLSARSYLGPVLAFSSLRETLSFYSHFPCVSSSCSPKCFWFLCLWL